MNKQHPRLKNIPHICVESPLEEGDKINEAQKLAAITILAKIISTIETKQKVAKNSSVGRTYNEVSIQTQKKMAKVNWNFVMLLVIALLAAFILK